MTTLTERPVETAVQTYRVYVRASSEAIWDALTRSELVGRYGYGGGVEYDLRPGGAFRALAGEQMLACGAPEVIIEGEVLEVEPGRRLAQTWHPVWSAEAAAEEPTRLTYEIEPAGDGVSSLTVVHDVAGAPGVAAMVAGAVPDAGGGWAFVLSDLKTLLETGSSLSG